jgi:hypothetical protein
LEWQDFIAFRKWALAHHYKEGKQIDRKDNNGIYEPSNCHWVTNSENQRNKRTNRIVTAFGKTKLLCEWSEEYGIPVSTLHCRLDSGLSPEEALTRPIQSQNGMPPLTIGNETLPFAEWCKRNGISYQTAKMRVEKGMCPEDAVSKPVDNAKSHKRNEPPTPDTASAEG